MNEAELYQTAEKFRKYFNSEDFTGNIEEELKSLVLTGEEVIRMGNYFLEFEESESYQNLTNKYENLKKGVKQLKARYKELGSDKEFVSKIEKIIQGKKGAIIDEIKEALKKRE